MTSGLFANLAKSRLRGEAGERAKAEGRALQDSIRIALRLMPDTLYKDRDAFVAALDAVVKKGGIKLRAPIRKAILAALSERDATAAICRDRRGRPKPDPKLRDTERVPLPDGADPVDDVGTPASVHEFFDREVKPHVPDAWMNTSKRDSRRRPCGTGRLRDQLQPLLLPLQAAPAARGDPGGYPQDRGRDGDDASGGGGNAVWLAKSSSR